LFALIGQTIQFLVFHALIRVVDRISRLPRNSTPPEVMRLMRENIALKAQVRALVLGLKADKGRRPKVSMRTRAAQVFAYLLTRGDKAFQNYYLSASRRTLEKWATRFRRGPWPWRRVRREGPPVVPGRVQDLLQRAPGQPGDRRHDAGCIRPWLTRRRCDQPGRGQAEEAGPAQLRPRDAERLRAGGRAAG